MMDAIERAAAPKGSAASLPDLAPMFAEARARGLWFFANYQNIWLSPDELRDAQANGRYRWASPWKLRDPRERLKELDDAIAKAEATKAEFLVRLRAAGVTD